jgi:four helix bundle protein
MYKFEKLNVWKKSLDAISLAYEIAKELPKSEERILKDQLLRAITSIALNIAEGCGALSDREFRRYLLLARKSLYEVIAVLKIIEKIYNIDTKLLEEELNETGKMLNGLIGKVTPSE